MILGLNYPNIWRSMMIIDDENYDAVVINTKSALPKLQSINEKFDNIATQLNTTLLDCIRTTNQLIKECQTTLDNLKEEVNKL